MTTEDQHSQFVPALCLIMVRVDGLATRANTTSAYCIPFCAGDAHCRIYLVLREVDLYSSGSLRELWRWGASQLAP